MNLTRCILPLSLALITTVHATPAHAQAYADEYTRLRDQQQKAIQAALDPIKRRYAADLQQLLRKATQAGDLATAVRIKAELEGADPAGALDPANGILIGKWQCHGSVGWDDTQEFKSDGTVRQVTSHRHGTWRIDGKSLIVTFGDYVQTYPLPLDPVTNKGKDGTRGDAAVRMTKIK